MGAVQSLRTMLDKAEETWTDDEIEELAAHARDIEERRTGFYQMSEEEEAAIIEAEAQEARGEIVSDDDRAAALKRYGL